MQAVKHRHREEVHYRVLSSGLWLTAKCTPLHVHTQLRVYEQPPPLSHYFCYVNSSAVGQA